MILICNHQCPLADPTSPERLLRPVASLPRSLGFWLIISVMIVVSALIKRSASPQAGKEKTTSVPQPGATRSLFGKLLHLTLSQPLLYYYHAILHYYYKY